MLLEKTWKNGDICTIKMSSGEEIVAKITDSNDKSITIHKPLMVQISVDPQTSRVGLQMVPGFVITANQDAKFNIGMQNVMLITPTEDNIKNSYLSSTSGLAIPSGGPGGIKL